ncbi:unnamed protein product [Dibothriocephalus latus]|uniref:Uncharacterized protein n=1 Tax=Dibothriocephalus latus TaxID=60516 RepID=A0A3P7MYX6_DIBLA|nr:unnamed protein product [Dibothriocephalus latus]
MQDGPFCRAKCPSWKYADEKTQTCRDCAPVCQQAPSKRPDFFTGLRPHQVGHLDVCSGPGDWPGPGGCNFCEQVAVSPETSGCGGDDGRESSDECASTLRCLIPYQACPQQTFLHLLHVTSGPLSGGSDTNNRSHILSSLSQDTSFQYVSLTARELVADWLLSLREHFSTRVVRICLPCHTQCSPFVNPSCTGPSATQCSSCRTAVFQGRCVAFCPDDTFSFKNHSMEAGNELENSTGSVAAHTVEHCLPCHSECHGGCSGPGSDHCKQCRNFKVFTNAKRTQVSCSAPLRLP